MTFAVSLVLAKQTSQKRKKEEFGSCFPPHVQMLYFFFQMIYLHTVQNNT